MPKVSGRDVLSEATEKSQAQLLLVASVAIISKAYRLPVSDMKMLGMEFPAPIFDVSMMILVAWYSYSYIVKWTGDLLGFRLWFSESSIWSEFGTSMKLDRAFISGGIDALKAFHEKQQRDISADAPTSPSEEEVKLYNDFKINVELYGVRLDHAGKKFRVISAFGHFYVWIQGFVFPMGAAVLATYLLVKYGSFYRPPQF